MHDGQIDSAQHSTWFKYEMASMPDILDPMGSPGIFSRYFRCKFNMS